MFKCIKIGFCVFLSSAFNSAWAEYCFENKSTTQIMPQSVCFQDISVSNWETRSQKLHLSTNDIDDFYSIQKVEKTTSGYLLHVNGDYLNYLEMCGVTLLSRFELRINFTPQGEYVHAKNNSLVIKYKYTANNCERSTASGTESFTPKM